MMNKFLARNTPDLTNLPMLDDGECYEPVNQGVGYLGHFASGKVLSEGHNVSARFKRKMHKTMHEYKHGTLHSGSKHGPKVKSRKQAVAIALSQARKEE